MIDALVWVATGFVEALWGFVWAVAHPAAWLDWRNPEAVFRFVYYGGSKEFFFFVLALFLVITGIGVWRRSVLWGGVIALETFANAVGRIAAWAGLLMVLQQVVIVFVQRIFAQAQISIGFGTALSFDISWWSEELKLYNAMVVALCCAWTFVQGGHVRVDLVYAAVSHRARRVIDMVGAVLFMMPFAVLTWMYGWSFMWRHLVTPKVSASDTFERMQMKARAFRWNVETIGFSPSGFNAYFLFKVLLVAFAGMVFLQAVAFFWRSYLELVEGPEAEGKHLDRDRIEPVGEMSGPQRLANE